MIKETWLPHCVSTAQTYKVREVSLVITGLQYSASWVHNEVVTVPKSQSRPFSTLGFCRLLCFSYHSLYDFHHGCDRVSIQCFECSDVASWELLEKPNVVPGLLFHFVKFSLQDQRICNYSLTLEMQISRATECKNCKKVECEKGQMKVNIKACLFFWSAVLQKIPNFFCRRRISLFRFKISDEGFKKYF